ncbi:Iron-regulated ABC transporter permease protein SufD [Anaerosphaera aminiphila DSM 21120]|uniref:Iron-regulated ABC transporter permease protein SufD n=1 Tax=Anaerosphaera aminiphila DSM 21120 TaxID=1120995 RepID=A0A1M5NPC8_9FIRM|nr:SufD family Fe-S cluster assembly protein [Anaerosphaera aminiphila]SHG90793.1 Iron-regulated ABC transporter permease protein SufD [Anaerosphaera aminiphila DSM 21120]
MSTKIIGNDLTFKTYSWLNVNNTEILIPELSGKKYMLKSDKKDSALDFSNMEYAISKEVIKLTEEYENLYRFYESKENETYREVVNLEINNEYNELLDFHDIVARKNSEVEVILNYNGNSTLENFRSSIIKVFAEENSKVNLFVIQDDPKQTMVLESIAACVEKDAEVNIYQYELGSSKLYSNFQSNLKGDNSELNLDGIYFGYDSHELNMLYNICHNGKNTNSDILINGALKDSSYKNLKSTLDFKKGSSSSVGSEGEYTILLDDGVTAISVPILLAHEDNIEGNHAASSGKIDKDLMFYIMSRGFSEKEAETLIVQSRFSKAIDKISDEEIKNKLWSRIVEIVRK